MYLVYRLSMNRKEVEAGDNIIAIYARKGGAIHRLETLAHANEGVTFGIAILPEGVAPKFENVKAVYAVMSVQPNETYVEGVASVASVAPF